MHQLLFGVGLVLVTLGPIAAVYGLSIGSPALTVQALSSFCLGVAYILIRNLVTQLAETRANLYQTMSDIYYLKQQTQELKEKITP